MKRFFSLFCVFAISLSCISCATTPAEDVGVVSVEVPAEKPGMVSNETIEEAVSDNAAVAGEEVLEESAIEPMEEEQAEIEPFFLYFSGIDVWGWTDTVSRSDVNILAAVNPKTRHIQLVNTPRDYYVASPKSGDMKDKLTHAGIYGVENSIGALEMLYGIRADYYVRMNFSGFEAVIDAMGGVDVYSEYDFTVDPIKHYVEGYNHLTGLEALAFVRERHAFKTGDNQRGKNQMALIQAMVKKICSPEILPNMNEILDSLTDMFRTSMTEEMIEDFIRNQILDETEWTVDTFAVKGFDGHETTYSNPNKAGYVMIPDEDSVSEAVEKLNAVISE